jgi:hypothetical protein
MRSPAVLPCRVQLSTLQLRDYVHVFVSGRGLYRIHQKLCGSLHQREQHSQSIVKLLAFRCAEALALLYSVLMNCVTREEV